MLDFSSIPDEEERRKQIKKFFDKSDLLSDEERADDLNVFNNDKLIAKHEELKYIGKIKTLE
jgi:hypothetical protein